MSAKYAHLKLKLLKQDYQYSLFDNNVDKVSIFTKVQSSKLPVAVFISEGEFSLMAPTEWALNVNVEKVEAGWSCFHIVGDMPFGTVQGLIANISAALFKDKIGVCIVSTFKSDWFFIRKVYLEQSINILTKGGWHVEKD